MYNSFGIYGIRNKINSKIYVGKTQNNFGDRRDCHWASLRGGYGVNPHLQRAWNKYGEENFEFIILHNCDSELEDINELEIKYIKKYKDAGKSYNISDGGDGGQLFGKHMSEETKRKIGEKNRVNMLGRTTSEETRKKMSEAQLKRYALWTEEDRANHGKLVSTCASGYRWSDESKNNFSNKQKLSPNGAKYNIDTIREIRRLHETENKTPKELSELFQIPVGTIRGIIKYRRWKYA